MQDQLAVHYDVFIGILCVLPSLGGDAQTGLCFLDLLPAPGSQGSDFHHNEVEGDVGVSGPGPQYPLPFCGGHFSLLPGFLGRQEAKPKSPHRAKGHRHPFI